MKRWIPLLLIAVLLVGAFPTATAAEQTTVAFTTESVFLAAGKATSVRVNIAPYVARKKGVTYQSSDEAVATVNTKGRITAVAEGECRITATSVYDPAVSASIPVKVVVPATKVTVTAPGDSVFVGQTLQLAAVCEPANATVQSVTYESSNEGAAIVSAEGLVTGIQRGRTTITVRSGDGFAKAALTLTVAQAPDSVDIAPDSVAAAVGKKATLKATVLPSDANNKTVLWSSANEAIATVNSKGQVTVRGIGETTVTATAADNPAASATIPVRGLELAQGINFDAPTYSVLINETVQTFVHVLPASASDKSVTYAVKNKRIATVNENGLVTGLKGGKTTLYAYTADGSKKRAAATIEVIVPVTGVKYRYQDVRVGAGGYATFTATISPSDATNKNMTWVSSDESIATVTGTNNRFRIRGRQWGRAKITGTTEDGGFTVEVYADIGSLRHAVTVTSVSIKNGKPYLVLQNRSDMDISQVRFEMRGYDAALKPVVMSLQGDAYLLQGTYNQSLSPGAKTEHGRFDFYSPSEYKDLAVLQFTITGWSTDTGYYDHNGKLQYKYNINEDQWEWVTFPADVTPRT